MIELLIHRAVHAEFLKAYQWYAERSRSAADRFRLHVRSAFDRIESQPMGGAVYDEGHRFYRVQKFPHLVIYRYQAGEDTATVVAISHPSQDQSYWQDR